MGVQEGAWRMALTAADKHMIAFSTAIILGSVIATERDLIGALTAGWPVFAVCEAAILSWWLYRKVRR